jgi:ribosomal RNA-processing protein 9
MDHARVHYTRRQRGPVTAAVASEDGKTLYTASKDGSISAYDLGTGSCSYTIYKARPAANVKGTSNGKGKGKGKKRADPNLEGHSDEIWALALSDDGKTLASAGKDRRIGVWDITPSTSDAKGKAKWRTALTGHRDGVTVRTTSQA